MNKYEEIKQKAEGLKHSIFPTKKGETIRIYDDNGLYTDFCFDKKKNLISVEIRDEEIEVRI